MPVLVETQTPETEPLYHIPIIGTFPGMNTDLIDPLIDDDTQALVLESNAHAALATVLHPFIRSITDRGIPVIVLADQYSEGHGVYIIDDEPQIGTTDSGGFYLETIGVGAPNADDGNHENLGMVVDVIKQGVDSGLGGADLGKFVQDQFRFPDGQKPERREPIDLLRAQHNRLLALGLGGLTVPQLAALEVAEADREK